MFFHNILWKNSNELVGQLNIIEFKANILPSHSLVSIPRACIVVSLHTAHGSHLELESNSCCLWSGTALCVSYAYLYPSGLQGKDNFSVYRRKPGLRGWHHLRVTHTWLVAKWELKLKLCFFPLPCCYVKQFSQLYLSLCSSKQAR